MIEPSHVKAVADEVNTLAASMSQQPQYIAQCAMIVFLNDLNYQIFALRQQIETLTENLKTSEQKATIREPHSILEPSERPGARSPATSGIAKRKI